MPVLASSSQFACAVCPFESRQAPFHNSSSEMRVVCVPVLRDNFAYLLIDGSGFTAAVDPAQPEKVRKIHLGQLASSYPTIIVGISMSLATSRSMMD